MRKIHGRENYRDKTSAQEAAELQIVGSREDTQTRCCFYLFVSICCWALQSWGTA